MKIHPPVLKRLFTLALCGLILHGAGMAQAFEKPAWLGVFSPFKRAKPSLHHNPLNQAIQAEDLKQVKRLLATKRELNVADADGATPLHTASLLGNNDIVKALLEKGVAVDASNPYGRTPLINASQNGHVDVVKTLIAHGANVNAVDAYLLDDTPLLYACKNGHFEIAKDLLQHGAKVNVVERERRLTPLHLASAFGYIDIVYVLLLNGANINAQDKDGKTPLAWAMERQQTAVVKLLKRSGGKI
jgi:ankyrin repeat protein